MLKILQARLQQYVNHESKTSTSALLTMPKPLTVWITKNCGKFWKRWEYQTTWPASWEICMQVNKQQLELDMEQHGSKLGKVYIKAVYCHSAYLISMQSTSCEMLGWMRHNLKSRLQGEISITSNMQITLSLECTLLGFCLVTTKIWSDGH